AFYSNMGTIVGWSQVTEIDNGNIAGSIVSDGKGFYPSAFGSVIDSKAWQGPALKTSLSKEVQNFRLDARVELTAGVGKTGMIEIYLLDKGNNIVGKVGIEDRISNTADPLVKAKAGDVATGTWFCSQRAESPTAWRNFDGWIRIQRVKNKWTAYFAQVAADGTHYARLGGDNSIYHLDVEEKYMSKIAQVQVAFRKFPNTQTAHMKVKDITINQINTENDGIPYILNEGDVLTLDHENCNILINGESRLDLKDFGADFFKLKPGTNEITMQPIVSDWSVSWRDRFK
ncbi:MAG: phage distal tail protein, partial [Candidatus Fimimonas sp.]